MSDGDRNLSRRPWCSILHPTDFSVASETAFAHALALGLRVRGKLTIVHVSPEDPDETPWSEFPSIRELVERWGLLPSGSPKSDVPRKLGLRARKVALSDAEPVDAILGYMDRHRVGMIVLATRGQEGLQRWLQGSVAESLARSAHVSDLIVMVTRGRDGFLDALRGSTTEKVIRDAGCPVLAVPADS